MILETFKQRQDFWIFICNIFFGTLMARTQFYTNFVTRSSPLLKFPTMIKFQIFNLAEKDKSQGIISV